MRTYAGIQTMNKINMLRTTYVAFTPLELRWNSVGISLEPHWNLDFDDDDADTLDV